MKNHTERLREMKSKRGFYERVYGVYEVSVWGLGGQFRIGIGGIGL